jgi:hypothetical protein
MQTNQSPSIKRQRTTRVLVLCLAMPGLFILMSFVVRGRASQGVNQTKLSVEDSRPVAKAIEVLEEKYGWVITYEDPRFVHASEIVDVALKVRRDLDKYKPGEVPPVFIPRGGPLEFTYDVASKTNLPTNPVAVVQTLLDAQAASSNGGRFRLESRGKIMHVIPTAIRNSQGRVVPQGSVLDTIISLPPGQRTVLQKLESICAAISRTTGIRIELGTIPDNWFSRAQDHQGAMGQRARDVLINTFASMESGMHLSWQLFYDPGMKFYALNIHFISKRDG